MEATPETTESGEGSPPVHRHASIGSTNSEALRLGEEGAPHLTAVVAEFQTAGRGKLESRWVMPAGEGVLVSVLMREMPKEVSFANLTLRVGWALAELLRGETGLDIEVKQPNDLLTGGKKLCGILCEARWRGETMLYAVIGVGINVNVGEFPEELRESACSLAQAAGREFDVEDMRMKVVETLRNL